jgi:AcrR family transcriptional regulator
MSSAVPSPPEAESRFGRKRALIIKSAAHVFGRKGFHATTLEEIAAELKVTKASLYYYFSTKEELLFEVHLLSMEDVLSRIDEVRQTRRSPVDQLRAAISEHLKVLAGDYEGAFLLQQEYDLPDVYKQQIVRLRDRYEQALLAIVHEGVEQRVFRVKDARVTVRMLLGAINWFLRWYRAGGRLTVEEIAEAYVDSIFHGILAPPTEVGRRALESGPREPVVTPAIGHPLEPRHPPMPRGRKRREREAERP